MGGEYLTMPVPGIVCTNHVIQCASSGNQRSKVDYLVVRQLEQRVWTFQVNVECVFGIDDIKCMLDILTT
jgi:hypothetical protein